MEEIDLVRLNFSPTGLQIMNVIIGFIAFGVALDMKPREFIAVVRYPKPAMIGLFTQFFIFPMFTFGLVLLIQPSVSIALGMILVSSCPGGNISNFFTQYARGNAALSISMSGISTAFATVMTPLNMSFWGSLYVSQSDQLNHFTLDFFDMFMIVFTLLIIPTILGLIVTHYFPKITAKAKNPMQRLSILFFMIFVFSAIAVNWEYLTRYYFKFVSLVSIHNFLSLLTGFILATIFRLNEADRRAVTIEVGIQNSGLGLIIIFNKFDGLGGMAIIAAAWGISHILFGLSLSSFWRSRKIE